MSIWITGWAGDNAGRTEGREPNQLLVTLTTQNGTIPAGFLQQVNFLGTPFSWFLNIQVVCLAPNSRDAIVIAVADLGASTVSAYSGFYWSLEVAEVDFGLGKAAWKPGVNLFSVGVSAPGGAVATAITSARIDDKLTQINLGDQQQAISIAALRPRLR